MGRLKKTNLDRDAIAATKAGMSYGQWKSLHPNTAPDKYASFKRCIICGANISNRPQQAKYCESCCDKRKTEHDTATAKRRYLERRANNGKT